jgi:hypothetical protein
VSTICQNKVQGLGEINEALRNCDKMKDRCYSTAIRPSYGVNSKDARYREETTTLMMFYQILMRKYSLNLLVEQ